jgi:PCFT/HCP family folate transporter-like MFS transporter 1/3
MDEFTKSLVNLGISSTLFYMVLFLTSPIAVQLTYQIVCDNVEDDNTMCDTSEVSSITSRTLVFVGLANTIPSFLLSGFYASVADRYGRKLAMHIPTLGYTVYVTMLLYMSITRSNGGHVSLTGVIIFNAIGLGSLGLSGSFTAYQMSLFTYTADITRKRVENRGTMYSILEASLFLSKTVGPVAAGTYSVLCSSFLFLLVMSLSCPSVAPCLHSLTRHDV